MADTRWLGVLTPATLPTAPALTQRISDCSPRVWYYYLTNILIVLLNFQSVKYS